MPRHRDAYQAARSGRCEIQYHWQQRGDKLFLEWVRYRRKRVWWKLWFGPSRWTQVDVGSMLEGVSVYEIGLKERPAEAAGEANPDGGSRT